MVDRAGQPEFLETAAVTADGAAMRPAIVLAVVAALAPLVAGCAAPETPEEWTVERQADTDPTTDPSRRLCDDVEAAGLGGLGLDLQGDAVIDGLAAIAAVAGATEALPILDDLRAGGDPTRWADVEDVLDPATFDRCGVPVFIAMRLTEGESPGWLPCFADGPDGYRAVHCGTGTELTVVDDDWVPTP